MQKIYVRRLETIHSVSVDSVVNTVWDANRGGVKNIEADSIGVRIHWNLGSTFVPWSNVRFIKEGF